MVVMINDNGGDDSGDSDDHDHDNNVWWWWTFSQYILLFLFQIPPLFAFFVPTGLGDRNEDVRKEMLNAALQAVNDHGKVKRLSTQSLQPDTSRSV